MISVVLVFWLRQLKRYVRSKARLIGSFGQPLLFLIALGFGFGPVYQKANGMNYLEFLSPGIIAMTVLFTSIFNGIEVIWDKQFGFLKETLVAPVPRLAIMVGRTLGGATVATSQGTMVLLISLLLGFRPHLTMLPLSLLIMFAIGLMFTALGTAIASLIDDMQAFPVIMNFIVMPLFFLSGALFPVQGLPKSIYILVLLNPFTYCIDGLRGTLTSVRFQFNPMLDLGVILLFIIFFSGLGAYLFSKIEI